MCQLGIEKSRFEVSRENPIVGIRLWKIKDNEFSGLQDQSWNGKTCTGDISVVNREGIPLGIYSFNNYNYYYNYYYNYNYNYLGEVNLSGKIVEHQLGYRAEFGEVKTLFLLDDIKGRDKGFINHFNNIVKLSSDKYQIPTMTEFEYLSI